MEAGTDVTLMHREDEVLAFRLNVETGEVGDVRLLERADLAPLGVIDRTQRSRRALRTFVGRRHLARNRKDLPHILEALSASHPVQLAIRAHGFSLSDQYWYRMQGDTITWAGSNFFDNGWDDAFGKAALARDYRMLAHVDSFVPDLNCGGGARKAWLHAEDGARLVKAAFDGPCELVGEVLSSRMLSRMLGEGEYLPYEPVQIGKTTYASCPCMVNRNEDLLNPPTILSATAFEQSELPPHVPGDWKDGVMETLKSAGVARPLQAIAKMAVVESLLFKIDFHSGNLGLIRKADSGVMHPAPFYDLSGAFGTFGAQLSSKTHTDRAAAAMFTVAWYSNVDPSWDYSWFDPSRLDGFGDELELALSGCEEIPADYPAIAHELFDMQLNYVRTVTGR